MFKSKKSNFYKFSEPISGNVSTSIKVSPSSEYIAVANGVKLNIYHSRDFQLVQSFSCLDKIDYCSFACDSDKILCFLKERNVVQAFSVSDIEWKCRINEGHPGIINAFWSLNGYYIITESDFGIQLTIWSLLAFPSPNKFIISNPKPNLWSNLTKDNNWTPCIVAFKNMNQLTNNPKIIPTTVDQSNNNNHNSTIFKKLNTQNNQNTLSTIHANLDNQSTIGMVDANYMTLSITVPDVLAVVHRYELHDFIAVYSCYINDKKQGNWEEITKFQCRTNDVASIQWLPLKSIIVAMDSPLTYNIYLYTPNGEVLGQFTGYQNFLGIRNISIYNPPPSTPTNSTYTTNNHNIENSNIFGSTTATTLPLTSSTMNYNNTNTMNNFQNLTTTNTTTSLSTQMIAVGSYDGKIRLLSIHNLQELFVLGLEHPRSMEAGLVKISLYTNIHNSNNNDNNTGNNSDNTANNNNNSDSISPTKHTTTTTTTNNNNNNTNSPYMKSPYNNTTANITNSTSITKIAGVTNINHKKLIEGAIFVEILNINNNNNTNENGDPNYKAIGNIVVSQSYNNMNNDNITMAGYNKSNISNAYGKTSKRLVAQIPE